jgi:hypothetical protein
MPLRCQQPSAVGPDGSLSLAWGLAITRLGDNVDATADAILIGIACWAGLSIVLGLLIGRGFRILGRSVPDPIPERVSAARTRPVARSSLASAAYTRAARTPAAPPRAALTR